MNTETPRQVLQEVERSNATGGYPGGQQGHGPTRDSYIVNPAKLVGGFKHGWIMTFHSLGIFYHPN
jgi:hypothetical protein